MNKILCAVILGTLFTLTMPALARAQGAAPEMFGVREVVVEYAHFDDAKAAEACGLSREQVATALAYVLKDSGVPAIEAIDARPASLGVARIELIPEISTYANESLDCVTFVSLSAENRVGAVIPPVSTLRSATIVYWRQHARVASGQSVHQQNVSDTLQKMAAQFAQQYKLDQPPALSK